MGGNSTTFFERSLDVVRVCVVVLKTLLPLLLSAIAPPEKTYFNAMRDGLLIGFRFRITS